MKVKTKIEFDVTAEPYVPEALTRLLAKYETQLPRRGSAVYIITDMVLLGRRQP